MGFTPAYGYDDLQRSALGFVLENESWPVFLAWVRGADDVSDALMDYVETADLNEARSEWLAHSPDPQIRAMAGGRLT
jgi:hypothetical protein